MKKLLAKFSMFTMTLRDRKGQGMVEYGLIIALIAVVVIGALVVLGPKVANIFTGVASKLTSSAG